MPSVFVNAFRAAVVGRCCEIERREHDWLFVFGTSARDGCVLATASWWRIISGGRVAHASEDDEQWFGLSEPIDGERRARSLFSDRQVSALSVDELTGDITAEFGPEIRLEILTSSSGYENWQAYFRHDGMDLTIIGLGGGELACTGAPTDSDPSRTFA